VTRRGDHVVVLLAGHGSQQPAMAGAVDEPDGRDEIFLPADAAGMNGRGTFTNAVTDDELGAWLRAIRATGAIVLVILDTSHNGSDVAGEERPRGIAASELLDGSARFSVSARPDPASAVQPLRNCL
jgi:hypothetical protein